VPLIVVPISNERDTCLLAAIGPQPSAPVCSRWHSHSPQPRPQQRRTSRSRRRTSLPRTFCNGDQVQLQGTIHLVGQGEALPDVDRQHAHTHFNSQQLSGIGTTSGDRYKVNLISQSIFNAHIDGANVTTLSVWAGSNRPLGGLFSGEGSRSAARALLLMPHCDSAVAQPRPPRRAAASRPLRQWMRPAPG
jgi:hypothetical protein